MRASSLYEDKAYKGYKPDIYVSQYPLHWDSAKNDFNEMGLTDYTNLVNNAIKRRDRKALEDAANYWSVRATISSPEARAKLKKVLKNYEEW